MTDIRRYSLAAVVLLVTLRLAIGWQLLYEGMWKFEKLNSPRPWTSAGYLRNATGPLRDVFRNMAGDPDELDWLNYDIVSARWQDWAQRFQTHYKLSEKQATALSKLLNGTQGRAGTRSVFAEKLVTLPLEGQKLKSFEKRRNAIWFDGKAQRLYIDAKKLLQPDEKAAMESLVRGREDAAATTYVKALNKVYDRQKKGLGFLRKLAGAVRGNPELLGDKLLGWEDTQQSGKLEEYEERLATYETKYANANTTSEWNHVQYMWGNIQTLRAELTGPVKAMEADLKGQANRILAVDQHTLGPVPKPWTMLRVSDTMTIVGLMALGSMLILGLLTRFAAVAAAVMLFSFYLAMPPLPGLPEIPGPEHSFVINKNLIEVFALLAIAALPSGKWFGLDGLLAVFLRNWRADKKLNSSLTSAVATGDEPEVSTATA